MLPQGTGKGVTLIFPWSVSDKQTHYPSDRLSYFFSDNPYDALEIQVFWKLPPERHWKQPKKAWVTGHPGQ